MPKQNKRSSRIRARTDKPQRRKMVAHTKAVGRPEIGPELKALRLTLGMSLEDVAKKLGCSYVTVWRWEHSKAEPPFSIALEWLRLVCHPLAICFAPGIAALEMRTNERKSQTGKVTLK